MRVEIPEEWKACINCKHDHGMDRDNPNEPCKECCNGWNGDQYEENHFEPDMDYLKDEIGTCKNCKHRGDFEICNGCSRMYTEDLWEPDE